MTEPEMIVIVPTRGRPHSMAPLQDAWESTAVGAAELMVAIDDDDPCLDEYLARIHHRIYVGPRRRLAGTLNACAVDLSDQTDVIGFMGDDHRPRTAGWDARIVAVLAEMKAGIAYGDDQIQGPNLPTAVFMTSNIVRTLGWMAPPGLVHLYIDNAWKLLGERADCLRYLPDVVIEHCHPIAGKASWDDGYREVNAGSRYESDCAAMSRWVEAGEMLAAVNKIRDLGD